MSISNNIEKVEFLVSHGEFDPNLCAVAYQLISKAPREEQAILLERFIRGVKNVKSDETLDVPHVFTDDDRIAYSRRYSSIVDGHLSEFLNSGLSEKVFYEELVNYILKDKNLLDDGARAIAIFECCTDKRLPYAKINIEKALKMTDGEYKECYEALGEALIDKVKYILNASLVQKTETASLLLLELDKIKDKRLKTVLLSAILTYTKVDAFKSGLYHGLKKLSDLDVNDFRI